MSRKRERSFMRRHHMQGRSEPRLPNSCSDTKKTLQSLGNGNFGKAIDFTMKERRLYRVYSVSGAGDQRILINVFAAPVIKTSGCVMARRMYMSRAEKNRLVHKENGNTVEFAFADRSDSNAYLSNKDRNRLAHVKNGNTTVQDTDVGQHCVEATALKKPSVDAMPALSAKRQRKIPRQGMRKSNLNLCTAFVNKDCSDANCNQGSQCHSNKNLIDAQEVDRATETLTDAGSKAQTDTLKEYQVKCQMHASNARRVHEVHLAKLALRLRELPTLPADVKDATQPCSTAQREDVAIMLPAAHCAFRGCAACGDGDEWLREHLRSVHFADFSNFLDASRCSDAAGNRGAKLIENMFSVYSEALAIVIRDGPPLATHSIDRRCLKNTVKL